MAVDRIGLRISPRYREIRVDVLLSEAAGRWPDKVAVIDGDRRTSFSDLEDSASRLASALAASGIAKGDRVGLLAPNCTEYVVAFFGVIRAGAVVTTLNAGYREREIAHQLNDNGASVLIVHESLLPVVESARPAIPALERLVVIGDGGSHESLQDLIERGLDASDIARGAAKAIGGGGGGRPDVAQAGGRDASKLDDALQLVSGLVEESLGS